MKYRILPVVLTAAALAATSLPAAADSPRARIIVSGEGEMAAAPDMAILSLTVLREAETAREALTANNEAIAKVIAAMKESGVADRDLQTSGFNIQPRYVFPEPKDGQQQQPRIVGYAVSNSLTVRVRDLAKVGTILDQSVTLGVNQGGDIVFTNDDPAAVINDARKKAVADAIAKAKTLAEAAGVNVGSVLEISEQTFQPRPVPMARGKMMATQASDFVPVAAGENTYNVQVNVTFEIKQ
ncbi:MAG: SIMPL domain-containing protein [Phyllobacterium sp.]